jgi:hypothetical protein
MKCSPARSKGFLEKWREEGKGSSTPTLIQRISEEQRRIVEVRMFV